MALGRLGRKNDSDVLGNDRPFASDASFFDFLGVELIKLTRPTDDDGVPAADRRPVARDLLRNCGLYLTIYS